MGWADSCPSQRALTLLWGGAQGEGTALQADGLTSARRPRWSTARRPCRTAPRSLAQAALGPRRRALRCCWRPPGAARERRRGARRGQRAARAEHVGSHVVGRLGPQILAVWALSARRSSCPAPAALVPASVQRRQAGVRLVGGLVGCQGNRRQRAMQQAIDTGPTRSAMFCEICLLGLLIGSGGPPEGWQEGGSRPRESTPTGPTKPVSPSLPRPQFFLFTLEFPPPSSFHHQTSQLTWRPPW